MQNFKFFDSKLTKGISNLDKVSKSILVQEANCFNDTKLNVSLCESTLVKVLYLLVNRQELTESELDHLFFSITKLFQTQNNKLRRLVYLVLNHFTMNLSFCIIMHGTLLNDINKSDANNQHDLFKAPALRMLNKVLDISSIQSVELILSNVSP